MSSPRIWDKPVAITGMGAITPYGTGVAAFEEGLRSGSSAIRAVELSPFATPRPAGLLPDLALDQWLESIRGRDEDLARRMKKILRRKPMAAVWSAVAAVEAWLSAGLNMDDYGDSGVVVGGHSLSSAYTAELRKKFDADPNHLSPSFAVNFIDTDHVGAVSEILQVHGAGMSVGGASASGQMAMIQAAHLIRLGELERCVVVGPVAHLSPMAIQAFDAIGALGGHDYADKPEQASRPFDNDRNGFIYGQASGALILESLSSCEKRQRPPLGYIGGAGIFLDATTSPGPSADGEAQAMRRAMDSAQIEAADIDTINAHATASHAGDTAELEAIHSVFGESAKGLCVQATKGLIGHTLWAAGVIESVAVLIQMQQSFRHPNLNLASPMRDDVGFAPAIATEGAPQIVLSNSFGFGGINTSIVITKSRERNSP